MLGRPLAFDFNAPPDPPQWLVDGLLERGTVNLLVADSGAGKSFICSDIVARMLRRERWIGREMTGDRVMVIDNENHPRLVKTRLHSLGMTNSQRDNLRYFCRLGVQLGAGSWFDRVMSEIEDFKPDLVILDTVGSCTVAVGNDGDSVMRLYATVLRPIAGQERSVLMLHHERKSQPNQPRDSRNAVLGSVHWRTQADAMFSLERKSEVKISGLRKASHERRYNVLLTMPKSRDGESIHIPLTFRSKHEGNQVLRTWIEERTDETGA